MNNNNLQESNWHSIRDKHFNIAILPWGATEAHNFHLPYGTDTYLAEHVASRSASAARERGVESVVLPPIAYGVNSGQMDIKLCMNIHPSTQYKILEDIVEVLIYHKIPKLVILNAHGGNNFQPIIRELSVKHPQLLICNVNWWVVKDPSAYFEEAGDHAGELETSCVQAIRPELVLPLEFAGGGSEHKMTIKAFRERWAWTPRRWIYTSDDTGVGNPYASDPQKGELFLNDCIKEIASFLVDLSKINSESDLYEK